MHVLTEVNKQIPPSLSLPNRQSHDTANVIVLRRSLLLREIPDKSRADIVHLCHYVEQEGLYVVEERFVV